MVHGWYWGSFDLFLLRSRVATGKEWDTRNKLVVFGRNLYFKWKLVIASSCQIKYFLLRNPCRLPLDHIERSSSAWGSSPRSPSASNWSPARYVSSLPKVVGSWCEAERLGRLSQGYRFHLGCYRFVAVLLLFNTGLSTASMPLRIVQKTPGGSHHNSAKRKRSAVCFLLGFCWCPHCWGLSG